MVFILKIMLIIYILFDEHIKLCIVYKIMYAINWCPLASQCGESRAVSSNEFLNAFSNVKLKNKQI